MSSQPDLAAHFAAMETLVESYPEGVNAEIAKGAFMMSPRPGPRHLASQGRLLTLLNERRGRSDGTNRPVALSAGAGNPQRNRISRLIPDIAGWRRSAGGWPPPEVNPIEVSPEWAVEVLSPSTVAFDRGPKKDAYGLMGVGWLWLLDVDREALETFSNERGRMVPAPMLEAGESLVAPLRGSVSESRRTLPGLIPSAAFDREGQREAGDGLGAQELRHVATTRTGRFSRSPEAAVFSTVLRISRP